MTAEPVDLDSHPAIRSIRRDGFLSEAIDFMLPTLRDMHADWFDFAERVNRIGQRIMNSAETVCVGGTTHDPLCVGTRLLIRSLSGFQAVVILAERGMAIEAHTLIRGLYENALWLGFLMRSPTEAVDALLVEEMRSRRGRDKALLAQLDRVEAPDPVMRARLVDRVEEADQALKGKRGLGIEELAAKGDCEDFYMFYKMLSSGSAHPSFHSLSKHLLMNPDGTWSDRVNSGEAREALAFAERFAALAQIAPDEADPLIAQRVRGWSRLMLGELGAAYSDITEMLHAYGPTPRRADVARFQYDQRSTARITLARALWLRGDADQALHEVADNIAVVTAADHTLSLAHVLSDAACFLALWRGDLDLAERYTALLRKHTGLQALDVWRTYGDCFEGEIRVRRGDVAAGLALLRGGIAQLQGAGFVCYHTAFLGVLAEALSGDGQASEALSVVDEALTRSERTDEAWCRPELLRIRGEILLGLDGRDGAEATFLQSLELATVQGALAWELRAATSWARVRRDERARERLESVLGRFREGFATADLRVANALLNELNG
jgi:tetratricopeptide (TPR) repeat protein